MKWIGCPGNKIDNLISTKKTRISINQMRKIITSIGFIVKQESNWFIRPAYSFRFGLPRIKNPFAWFPFLNEIFCNGVDNMSCPMSEQNPHYAEILKHSIIKDLNFISSFFLNKKI